MIFKLPEHLIPKTPEHLVLEKNEYKTLLMQYMNYTGERDQRRFLNVYSKPDWITESGWALLIEIEKEADNHWSDELDTFVYEVNN